MVGKILIPVKHGDLTVMVEVDTGTFAAEIARRSNSSFAGFGTVSNDRMFDTLVKVVGEVIGMFAENTERLLTIADQVKALAEKKE